MSWKAIGQSVTGSSHTATGKTCEDAIAYKILNDADGHEVLICCMSDGAGSAARAATASALIAHRGAELLETACIHDQLDESTAYELAEKLYGELKKLATESDQPIEEYAATMLACAITPKKSLFLQIGDGAMVRKGEDGTYQLLWWPQSGEYHNTTHFLVDDENMANLNVLVTENPVCEVALFTDGLQMLAISMEARAAHAPFFDGLFAALRQGDNETKLAMLNEKMADWLNSAAINNRTDDDKTLFLATSLNA